MSLNLRRCFRVWHPATCCSRRWSRGASLFSGLLHPTMPAVCTIPPGMGRTPVYGASRNSGILIQWKPPLALESSAEGMVINVLRIF